MKRNDRRKCKKINPEACTSPEARSSLITGPREGEMRKICIAERISRFSAGLGGLEVNPAGLGQRIFEPHLLRFSSSNLATITELGRLEREAQGASFSRGIAENWEALLTQMRAVRGRDIWRSRSPRKSE